MARTTSRTTGIFQQASDPSRREDSSASRSGEEPQALQSRPRRLPAGGDTKLECEPGHWKASASHAEQKHRVRGRWETPLSPLPAALPCLLGSEGAEPGHSHDSNATSTQTVPGTEREGRRGRELLAQQSRHAQGVPTISPVTDIDRDVLLLFQFQDGNTASGHVTGCPRN